MNIEPLDPTENEYEINRIITEPSLFKLTYGQGCLVEEFKVDKTSSYLGVIYQKELCGMFQLRPYNQITVDAHIYMLPRYQARGLSIKAINSAQEYLKENSTYKNIITAVPLECVHVLKLLQKTNFKVCGQITNGVVYNENKQNLILFQAEI